MTTADQIVPAPPRRFVLPPEAIEQISRESRDMHPVTALLGLIGWLIVGLVWLAGKTWNVVFFLCFRGGAWVFAAGRMGWRMSQGQELSQPTMADLLRENDALRKALARVDPGG